MENAVERQDVASHPGSVSPPDDVNGRARDDLRATEEEAILRMCHDLVTPAVTIRHLAETIAMDRDLSEETRRRMALIATESTNISEICAFALEAVRELRPVRLDLVIRECVGSIQTWFAGTIDAKVREGIVVSAQRVPILRLVSNLLNNACQAAGSGGVRIRLDSNEDTAHLEVTNSGESLEPGLFLGPEGSGRPATLGLRIVTGILRDYGGHIHCESGIMGGTTVTVELPMAEDVGRRNDFAEFGR